jgi:hypothetical protein
MGQGSRFSLTHGRMYYVDESMCLYILIELTTRLVNTRTSCTVGHLISGKGLLRYMCACFGESQSSSRSCSVFCVHVHSGGLVAYELFNASLRLLESSESRRRMYAAGCVC